MRPVPGWGAVVSGVDGQVGVEGTALGVQLGHALLDPGAPRPGAWQAAVAAAVGAVDERTHLVGHSLGCVAVLRHLASLPGSWELGGLTLVAGFTGPLTALPVLDGYLAEGVTG